MLEHRQTPVNPEVESTDLENNQVVKQSRLTEMDGAQTATALAETAAADRVPANFLARKLKKNPMKSISPISRLDAKRTRLREGHPGDVSMPRPPASEILPFLYLGNYHNAANKRLMECLGITHIVNATVDFPNVFEYSFTYLRVPVEDNCQADLSPHFEKVVEFIDDALRQKGRIFVHCMAGISRSPSLVIAYLVAHSRLSVVEAFTLTNHSRSIIAPSFHFLGQVQRYRDCLEATQMRPLVPNGEVEIVIGDSWGHHFCSALPNPVVGCSGRCEFGNF